MLHTANKITWFTALSLSFARPDFIWLGFDRGSGAPARLHEIKWWAWKLIPHHLTSQFYVIKPSDTKEEPSRVITDDLPLFFFCSPSVYFFLSSLSPSSSYPFIFYFSTPPFYTPSMKGAIKQPEMMLVNKSFGEEELGVGVGKDGEKKTLKDKGRRLIRGGKLRRGCVLCVWLFDH